MSIPGSTATPMTWIERTGQVGNFLATIEAITRTLTESWETRKIDA
jgi:hypothetical protein